MAVLRRFVAAFTETEQNLGLARISQEEQGRILAQRPWWAKVFRHGLVAVHRARMWGSGTYGVKPFRYALFAGDRKERVEFEVSKPTARWRRGYR